MPKKKVINVASKAVFNDIQSGDKSCGIVSACNTLKGIVKQIAVGSVNTEVTPRSRFW